MFGDSDYVANTFRRVGREVGLGTQDVDLLPKEVLCKDADIWRLAGEGPERNVLQRVIP